MFHRRKDRHGTEESKSKYTFMVTIFKKGAKTIQWGKVFHKWCWDYWISTIKKKNKTASYLTIDTKINSKQIKGKSWNYKTFWRFGNGFLGLTPKTIKEINQTLWNLSFSVKDHQQSIKTTHGMGENVCKFYLIRDLFPKYIKSSYSSIIQNE